jgi:hypothetical protein
MVVAFGGTAFLSHPSLLHLDQPATGECTGQGVAPAKNVSTQQLNHRHEKDLRSSL